MPLTKAREIALFEVLEVPYATVSNDLLAGGLAAQPHEMTGSARSAKTMILAHVESAICGDADIQAVLEVLLDRWIAMGTDASSLEGGSFGNVSGVTDNPDDERAVIRRKVLVQVPFWRHHQELLHLSGGNRPLVLRT